MRQVKFRAWDKISKKMVDVKDIGFDNNGLGKFTSKNYLHDITYRDYINGNVEYIVRYISDVELMQSTGLKDKNGVEIFEGDMLEYEDVNEYPNHIERKVKIIEVKNLDWYIRTHFSIPNKISKVIGNIHDNPELIKS